jgi:hypothetical protein
MNCKNVNFYYNRRGFRGLNYFGKLRLGEIPACAGMTITVWWFAALWVGYFPMQKVTSLGN